MNPENKASITTNTSNDKANSSILGKQNEKTIFDIPISEIQKQCQAYQVEPPLLPPLLPSRNPNDTVIEGGEMILNNSDNSKIMRKIYRKGYIQK